MDPIQQAIELIKLGDPREARNILVEYLKTNPDDPRGWALLARIVNEPQYKEELLKRVLALPKDDSGVYEWASKQLAELRFGGSEGFDPNVTQSPMSTQELPPAYARSFNDDIEETQRGQPTQPMKPFAGITPDTSADLAVDPFDETHSAARTTRLDRDKIAEMIGPSFDDEGPVKTGPNLKVIIGAVLVMILIVVVVGGGFLLSRGNIPNIAALATETPTLTATIEPTITPTLVPIFTPTSSLPTETPGPTLEPSPTLLPPIEVREAPTRLIEAPIDVLGFGQRVALSESTLAVGGVIRNEEDATQTSFIILLYNITAETITEEARIPFGGAGFTIEGQTAAIRNPEGDISYVERDEEGTWSETATITSPVDAPIVFGSSISLSNGVMAVSAIDPTTDDQQAGTVYVYRQTTLGDWQLTATLQSEEGAPDFGTQVVTDGQTVAINAPLSEAPTGKTSGLVYVYVLEGEEWLLRTLLFEENGNDGDRFGQAIALQNDTLAVTTSDENNNRIITYNDVSGQGEWEQVPPRVLEVPDVDNPQGYGSTVAVADDVIVTTAPLNANAVMIYLAGELDRTITSAAEVLYQPSTGSIATSGGLIAVIAPDVLGGSPAILLFSLAEG